MKHGLAFALGCLRDPRRMGAVAPASRALARAIVSEVWRSQPGVVVEVGAGTGAITQELVTTAAALDAEATSSATQRFWERLGFAVAATGPDGRWPVMRRVLE